MTTIALNHISVVGSAGRSFAAAVHGVIRVLVSGWMTLELWRERAQQRRRLMELDDRLLRDIGLSRADAEREGRKPFWKP